MPTDKTFKEKAETRNQKNTVQRPGGSAHSKLNMMIQLELLRENVPSGVIPTNDMSNTVDFWDQIPKFFIDMKRQNALRDENGKLPSSSREFTHQSLRWKVVLHPARVTEDGKEIEYLPGPTEELVEEALRRLSIIKEHELVSEQDAQGRILFGAKFTLYALQRELSVRGHTIAYSQLIRSLYILNGCRIEVFGTAGKKRAEIHTAVISEIRAVGYEDWKADPSSKWIVFFSSTVADSIRAQAYRKIDYGSLMEHKSQLSRWIHRRLTSQYVQASLLNNYTIRLSRIEEDSGLLDLAVKRHRIRKLREALEELVAAEVIGKFEIAVQRGKRNLIIDAVITLWPHKKFVRIAKETNYLLKRKYRNVT